MLLAASTAFAQVSRQTLSPVTNEDLRGVSAVTEQVAWVSGTHGTYLRTSDGGRTWLPGQVPGAEKLDFRGVVAFSADEAFLMSAGPGEQSRIYHTGDAGLHWQLQFTASNPKSFFDSIAFWDRTHGVALGDPVPDETGKLKFQVLLTQDGQTWQAISAAQMPVALQGEGAFAASNRCLALLNAEDSQIHSGAGIDSNLWFATGGKSARVFHSADRGQTWGVFDTPIAHGPDSAGIFAIAFRDPWHGVIAGGDYKQPERDGPNLAFTKDGGKTWSLSQIFPQSFYSAVAYDRGSLALSLANAKGGGDDNRAHIRLFVVSPKFVFDFRPPKDPTRVSPPKNSGVGFNAVSPFPKGGALLVGPKGSIVTLP